MAIKDHPVIWRNSPPFKEMLFPAMNKAIYDKIKLKIPEQKLNKYHVKLSIPKETLTEKASKLVYIAKIITGI